MKTALLLVGFQSNRFIKGKHRVKGAKKSAKAASRILAYFREQGLPIIHILQTGKLEHLSVDQLQAYEPLEPQQDEVTLVIGELNAMASQKLHQKLQQLEIDHLLLAGLMLEKEILATALGARELDYALTIAADACTASPLKLDGEKLKAEMVHTVILATLNTRDAEILTVREYIKTEEKKIKKRKKEAAKHEKILEAAIAALEATPEDVPKAASGKGKKRAGAGKSGKSSIKGAKGQRKENSNPTDKNEDLVGAGIES